MHRVILAGGYPAGTEKKLRAALPAGEFTVASVNTADEYAAMTGAELLVLRVFRAEAELMDRNPGLKMILRWGTGTDSVDLAAAEKRGIAVTNTPAANAAAVAEFAIMQMLAVGRMLAAHVRDMERGEWNRNTYINDTSCLGHKTVGLVGAGNIGRRVAGLANAFGAGTVYFDMYRLPESVEKEYDLTFMPFDELLATADIVSLHLPLTEQTRHIIGADELALMKPGAILINTARGPLVDGGALLEALREKRLAGVGLDVFEEDPLPPDHPLRSEPRALITPHVAGTAGDIGEEMIPMLAADMLAWAAGETPPHLVRG